MVPKKCTVVSLRASEGCLLPCLELYKPSRFYCWLETRWPDIRVSCSANVGVQLKKNAKLPLYLSPVLAV